MVWPYPQSSRGRGSNWPNPRLQREPGARSGGEIKGREAHILLRLTSYRDGVIPERLQRSVAKESGLAELIVIAPLAMDENMTLLNAADMSKALADSGKVVLYGINFDTDKDTLRP